MVTFTESAVLAAACRGNDDEVVESRTVLWNSTREQGPATVFIIRDFTDVPRFGKGSAGISNSGHQGLIEGDYRIIYHRLPDRVEVVSVIHGRMSLESLDDESL